MRPNRDKAEQIFRNEFAEASESTVDPDWAKRFENLGKLVGNNARTIIAILGTQLLAKVTNPEVSIYALQAQADVDGAFSARGLCTNVMAPVAMELGIDLGVKSPEPHNNQPFFRRRMIDDSITEDVRNEEAYSFFLELLKDLESVDSREEFREIFRTFTYVRSETAAHDLERREGVETSILDFAQIATQFVAEKSETGRRAQAVAVGLLDILATSERVEVGRINDPDRHFPGDVAVRDLSEAEGDVRVWEVRDKPVTEDRARFSAQKCADVEETTKLSILAVSQNQPIFDTEKLLQWAEARGVMLRFYFGWEVYVRECFFWSAIPTRELPEEAHEAVHDRLKQAEVSRVGLRRWSEIFHVSD